MEMFWFASILITSGLLGLWFMLARSPVEKRLAITVLVLSIALHLLFGNNKLWVGHQGLKAELNYENDRAVLVFRDVAGNPVDVSARPELKQEVFERLTRLKDNGKPRTELADLKQLSDLGTNQLVIDFGEAGMPPQQDLVRWLVENRFRLRNPEKSLLHVNLGIDLRGGVEFTARLFKDGTQVPADDDIINILQRRLDASGMVEPQVFRLTSGDVQIVIPGGTEADAARTRGVLETTGRLEVREVLYFLQEEDVKEVGDDRYSFPDSYPNTKRDPFADVVYPFVTKPGEAPRFAHLGPVAWEGRHVDNAQPTTDETGQLAVAITLTAEGAPLNRLLTETALAKRLAHEKANSPPPPAGSWGDGHIAITLDGKVESSPVVQGASGKNTQITGGVGGFTQDEVDQLRTVLKAGSLAVTPRVVSERIVGPTLGKETIEKGAGAMLAALLVVLLIMGIYYQARLGGTAIVSLVVTVSLIFVVLSIFGATLTLPGMAGLVLTVGMAVDANILIFERLREESAEDVDIGTVIENGYSRAFITILDANLTTFLTALILYVFGAGPVKGFGMILMIGIGTSMFAALYVGRMLTDWLYRGKTTIKVPNLVRVPHLPFSRYRFIALTSSVLVALGSWAWFFAGVDDTDDRFGNDFTGGYQVQVNFNEPLTMQELSQRLAAVHAELGDEASLLEPSQLQMLPYYTDFAESGAGTNQWMFKGRDLVGARLERERAAMEDRLSAMVRDLERQAAASAGNRDQALYAELQREIPALRAQIDELSQRLDARQDAFKVQMQQAMPGALDPEGDELHEASFEGRTLRLVLGTIAPASLDAVTAVAAELQRKDHIVSATVEAGERAGRPVIQLAVTLVTDPIEVRNYSIEGTLEQKLARLLATDVRDPMQLGRYKLADELLTEVATVLADRGVTIDRPFPSSQHFSPLVGDQMKSDSLLAMILAVFVILAYVAARFEFRYGIGAIIALVHDLVLTIGLLAIFEIQIDLTVIAALLTIIGYSLNDTMVVFDRIRENIKTLEKSLNEIVDISISQTMSRTILTSATTVVVVVILVLFGGEGLAAFSGTLLIGLVLGTYSSVFVAAPVLVMLNKGRPAQALLAQTTYDEDEDEPGVEIDYSNGPDSEPRPA